MPYPQEEITGEIKEFLFYITIPTEIFEIDTLITTLINQI